MKKFCAQNCPLLWIFTREANLSKFSLVVLISGNGSNLQALIDEAKISKKYQIKAVISNNPDALGIIRAKRENIKTYLIDHRDFNQRADFDAALKSAINQNNPDLIVLAGFMRKLGSDIVNYFANKIINIHPSLLPKFPGLNTHQKAIAANETEHGCSIHIVTPELDAGPILAQTRIPILPNAAELSAEVQKLEHKLLPIVVNWFATGRLSWQEGKIYLDGKPLPAAGLDPFLKIY